MFPNVSSTYVCTGSYRSLCSLAVRRVPPRFSIPPTDNEIMPGGSVNITCVAVGSPMPYVKWMLGSEDLTPEDDMPIGRNVLELTDVRQSANYTCVAMSTLGVIEAVAQITVKGENPRDGLIFNIPTGTKLLLFDPSYHILQMNPWAPTVATLVRSNMQTHLQLLYPHTQSHCL